MYGQIFSQKNTFHNTSRYCEHAKRQPIVILFVGTIIQVLVQVLVLVFVLVQVAMARNDDTPSRRRKEPRVALTRFERHSITDDTHTTRSLAF